MSERTQIEDELAKARRHVEDARRLVWEQRGRIMRLRASGRDTHSAEKTLRILETNLQTFREHQSALEHNQRYAEGQNLALPPRLRAAE